MKCESCQVDKLSHEFPRRLITERCNHISKHCLSCLVNSLKKTDKDTPKPQETQTQPSVNPRKSLKCPQCDAQMSHEEKNNLLSNYANALFKLDTEKICKNSNMEVEVAAGGAALGKFYVVMLNGHISSFDLSKVTNVTSLRINIQRELNLHPSKQKLIFNRQELTDSQSNGQPSKLADFGIKNGSRVQLIVILYSITNAESIRSLVFELNWGYPAKGIDYLDGTCLVYSGDILFKKYDYMSVFYPNFPHMRHSSDVMDNNNKKGSHRITARLDMLPDHVTQLYFVLSAFNAGTIGEFRNPGFKLFDEASPEKQLCTYTFDDARQSQAVIMCCVTRSGQGAWHVLRLGELSQGNANDYTLIEIKIESLGLFI